MLNVWRRGTWGTRPQVRKKQLPREESEGVLQPWKRMSEEESTGERGAVLLSITNTSNLLGPIASSQRIKYTCVGVSPRHVALGANTGGVYCFYRHDYSYIRILAHQEGSISMVRFSPGGGHLAVVSGGGLLSLWELNLTDEGISKRVHVCSTLKEEVITDLVWDGKGSRVFFGTDQGKVAVSYLPKKMFKKPDDIIHTEKTVVQMDMHQDQLLVSMVTRCIIINVTSHEVLQVGKRARDGAFGACFHLRWPGKPPVVYSARPSSRMWAADITGTVVSTLQLKKVVCAPPSPLFGEQVQSVAMPTQTFSVPQLHFPQLFVLYQHYMVGWAPGSALCFFQCSTYKLATWTCVLEAEDKLFSDGTSLWLVCAGGRSVKKLQLVPVREALKQLLQLQLYSQACVVITMHYDEVMGLLPHDHTLLRNCDIALNGPDCVLSQQLIELKKTIATLQDAQQTNGQNNKYERQEEDKVDKEQEQGGSGRAAAGSGEDLQREPAGGSREEEEEEEEEEGHKVLLQLEHRDVQNGEKQVGDPVSTEAAVNGVAVPNTHKGTEQKKREASEVSELLGVSSLSGQPASMTTKVTEEDGEFPSGPVLPVSCLNGVEEVDLDSVARAEEELVVSDTGPHLPEEWGGEAAETGVVDVVRSQSKTIPVGATGSQCVTALEAGSSRGDPGSAGGTPSLASSYGETPSKDASPVMFTVGVANATATISPSENVDREALTKRTRQMALEEGEEEVIAVPIVTRSSSSGSLTGKAKSKKKSRRKKSSTSQKESPDTSSDSTPSLPVSKVSPTPPTSASLLYIPEEQEEELLPFPDVGLPAANSSPSVSMSPSPYPSLPPTPPLLHSPPPASQLSTAFSELSRDREVGVLERRLSGNREPVLDKGKSRSSSIDLSAIGGALSKGQKAVRGFLSSLSSQHMQTLPQMEAVDLNSPSMGSQPVLYRNKDAELPHNSFSPPSSAEEGELAEQLSPLAREPPHMGALISQSTSQSNRLSPQSGGMPPQEKVPTSHPEVTVFTSATMATRESLDSPTLLCSPTQLASELRGWLQNLEAFHSYMMNSDLVLATTLSPSVYSCACYLTCLCAEMDIFSAHTESSSDSHAQQPCRSLEAFIQCYSDCVDRGRLLQLLCLKDWETRTKCWKILATSLHGDPVQSLHKDLPTALLQLPANKQDTLHLAADKFPQVPPWQVALACQLWDDQSECATRHDYVGYLCELLGNAVSDVALSMLSEAFGRDAELLIMSLRTVLQVEEVDYNQHTMEDGRPRKWSHMIEWEQADCLEWLVDMTIAMETATDKQTAAEACREGGYWLGYVKLLVAIGDKTTALKTLLALGDVKLLTQTQPWGFLLETMDDWELVLKELAPPIAERSVASSTTDSLAVDGPQSVAGPQSVDEASEELLQLMTADHPPVSEEPPGVDGEEDILLSQLLPSLLWTASPETISSLLTEHSCVLQKGRWGVKEQEIHSLILAVASLHTQQRGLAHSLLEKLDRYLWTKRANTVAPHLRLLLQAEREAEHVTKDTLPLSPTIALPVPVHLRLEDINSCWGTRTSSRRDRCAMCGLALTCQVAERHPGLVTFLCGHAVHRNCAPEGACVLCFQEKIPSHLFSPRNTSLTNSQQLANLLFKTHP